MLKKLAIIVALLICFACLPLVLAADPYQEPIPNAWEAQDTRFDSLNVWFIGSWPFGPSEVVAIDSVRNLAFVGSGAGVYILGVSDSTNPIKISEKIHTRDWIRSLFFDKSTQRLCIANYYAGFEIWNTSDPQNPERLCSYHDIFPVLDISIQDSLVYVANSYTGLHIFNISDPMNPEEIGFFQILHRNHAMTIEGSYAYMVSPGLSVIDVSNPEKPELVGFWDCPGGTRDVCVIDTIAFIAGSYYQVGCVWILNVSDPHNPQFISSCPLPNELLAYGSTAKDSIVYVACDWEGLSLINASDLLNPFVCGYVDLSARDVSVAMPYAYVSASWCQGMRIINVANPSNPYQTGQYKGPKTAEDVWITWPYAYVANNEGGLRILDISDPQNPNEISCCEFRRSIVQSVFVVDSLAYIASRSDNQGLRIINIKDPFNPSVMSQCSLPGSAYDVFIKDTFACITGTAGLRMVNIADPINPYQAGYYPCGNCKCVFVRDSLAYFTTRDFHIVDISNPSNIKEVGYYETPAYAHGVTVDGNIAYITGTLSSYENLMLLDISDPENPVKISSYETAGGARACFVHESYAYLSSFDGGLRIIDVSSPTNPFEVGYYQTPTFLALNSFVSDSFIYVAAACLGLEIYQFYGVGVEEETDETLPAHTSIKLLQNPVLGEKIEVMLTINNPANFSLELFNALGQRANTYELRNLTIGKNIVRLSIDEIPAGVYFIKMKDGKDIQSEKAVILK